MWTSPCLITRIRRNVLPCEKRLRSLFGHSPTSADMKSGDPAVHSRQGGLLDSRSTTTVTRGSHIYIDIPLLRIVRLKATAKIWSDESVDTNNCISLVSHSVKPFHCFLILRSHPVSAETSSSATKTFHTRRVLARCTPQLRRIAVFFLTIVFFYVHTKQGRGIGTFLFSQEHF